MASLCDGPQALPATDVSGSAQADRNAARAYRRRRMAHWDAQAAESPDRANWGHHYRQRLARIYKFLVAPGQRVLEIGCGRGDLLASLRPAVGVGVDFSEAMLRDAAQRHPELHFVHADAHELSRQAPLPGLFDVVILSDVVNDLWDVQTVLQEVARVSHAQTRIIVNSYSRLWEVPLAVARRLHLARPTLQQNWLTVEDITALLRLTDFEPIRQWQEVLWPLPTPVLDTVCNRLLVKTWPFRLAALSNFVVARPAPRPSKRPEEPLVSVVIPARNESGNIEQIFARTPELGRGTELVFVEGHSRDNTYEAIEKAIAAHPERRSMVLRQTGVGKGDAVRLGFAAASGDILMILDADMTVPPEDLSRFYDALHSGKAEFVNGVRLVYPMEQQAMRFLNLLGNKFFSLVFSWLLGQPVKDTLCGTKALWRSDYELIVANRDYFGDFDPFGDFDLLFGAAKLNLKILDLPIRYRERTYGETNIQRWKHGFMLLQMVMFAARKLKFV